MKTVRTFLRAVLLTSAVLVELLLLRALDYSTSWLVRAADADAIAPPSPVFEIGGVRWDVERYASDPELDVLRRSFTAECGASRPVDAALCVSNRMARQFPHGEPVDEFVATSYDPSAHAKRHANGAPGHCVTRSAILASELLSVGVPARIVQLAPRDGSGGHNLVEVWDEPNGWVMVDPTYGGMVGTPRGPTSAVALSKAADEVRWFAVGDPPEPFRDVDVDAAELEAMYRRLFPSAILYPEPWLYLRSGDKEAPWPFRGTYVQFGLRAFTLGPAHELLLFAIPLTAIVAGAGWLSFVSGICMGRRRRRTEHDALDTN